MREQAEEGRFSRNPIATGTTLPRQAQGGHLRHGQIGGQRRQDRTKKCCAMDNRR